MGFCSLFWFAFHCFSMLFFLDSDAASDQPLQEGGKFFLFDASKNTKRHEIFFDDNVHFKDLKIVRPYHRTWFSPHGTYQHIEAVLFFPCQCLVSCPCLMHCFSGSTVGASNASCWPFESTQDATETLMVGVALAPHPRVPCLSWCSCHVAGTQVIPGVFCWYLLTYTG